MANEVNIYTPRYLAEVVRQAPPVHTFFRDTFFTNVKKSTTERVDTPCRSAARSTAACGGCLPLWVIRHTIPLGSEAPTRIPTA